MSPDVLKKRSGDILIEVQLQQVGVMHTADRSIKQPCLLTMATPPLSRVCVHTHTVVIFCGFNFVDWQLTTKTAKIGPHENFPLYGNIIILLL